MLIHQNMNYDLRQSVGLSGLSNNSKLIIRPITQKRDQSVTVCVQLDDQRQVGEFTNNQSLWEIIGTLFSEQVLDCSSEISCLYMRTEVSGIDKLKETKLNTLGILSGKVAIKLKIGNSNLVKASSSSESNKFSKFTKDIDQKVTNVGNSISSKLEMLKNKLASKKKGNNNKPKESTSNVLQAKIKTPEFNINDELIEIYIDDRKVLLFSQDDKQQLTSNHEVSDDFFEITKDDVRKMYGDLQVQKSTLEDRPLETKKIREQRLIKEEKKYEFTIIRLNLPFDHLILQTIFKPTDTIDDLINLAKQFVNETDFYLYTAPPKKVLDNKNTFLKEKLVPAAVIQFGGHQKPVIKDEFKQQISSFIFVASYTTELRNKLKQSDNLQQQDNSQLSLSDKSEEEIEKAKKEKEERLMKLLNMKK